MTFRSKSYFFAAALAFLAPAISTAAYAETTERDQAAQFAAQWLSLVDHQQYADAWQDTTKKVPLSKFLRDQAANKEHQRDTLARNLSHIYFVPNPGCFALECFGAPDGDRVELSYVSSFDKKRQTVETVAVVFDHGIPKIASYSVR